MAPNIYQFIFNNAEERDVVMQGRQWLFDNYLLLVLAWEETESWKISHFNVSLFWIQVWNIPHHWLSIKSGEKIGQMLGIVTDVLIVESGRVEEKH